MDVNPGVTFSDSDASYTLTASSDTLHNFLASANVVDILATEHAATSYVIFRKGTTPSGVEDQNERTLWYDETSTRFKERADTVAYHDFLTMFEGVNATTAHWPKGAVVVADSTFEVSPCLTANWPNIVGVATTTVPGDSSADIQKFGLVEVQCKGPFSPGEHLIASGTEGFARSSTFLFGANGAYTSGYSFGQFLYSKGAGFSDLVTCFVWL